jgi:hypothetical protein
LGFQFVQLLNKCALCVTSVYSDASHLLCLWWQTDCRYFQILCQATNAVPKFQSCTDCVNVLTARLLKWLTDFWKMFGP